MKRVLSLVLALVMVLGTLPMAFAADETAGEMLQAAGFVAGDENGNLMEDESLTRAMLAVLVAELNGVKENAKTYAIAPEFPDVTADDWFGPYVAYAAKEGWFEGDDAGNFNPNATVSDQTMATVMLRALGYEPVWATAISEAKAMGLPVGAEDAAAMTRGEAFATMWGVVNTPKKDSDVALGVELGKIEPAKEEVMELVAVVDTSATKALGNTLVNVDFDGSVDAAAAGEVSNYTIVEKADATKEIAVLSVDVFDGDDVFLETEPLTAGKAYSVIVGDSIGHFSGIAKDADKPSLDSVKGTDTGEIEVIFEDAKVDRASAEDVANYSLSGEGTIVKAEVGSGLEDVTLTVEGMTSTKSQKLTVENVMSVDGVVMVKEIKSFGPKYDKTAPKIDEVEASAHNNVEVLITWDDDHGVDQATAEDVSNYHIDGLEIISAKATYINDDNDDYYDKVILTTEEQTKSKSYELEVKYMVDGSTAANATTKVLTEKFRGGSEDNDEPKVDSADAINLTEVEVIFDEENVLDVATVLDAGNYEFDDNELEVVDVRFDDADDNGNSYSYNVTGIQNKIAEDNDKIKVILTVTEMEEDESYKLRINNIADNFGNVMDDEAKETIKIGDEVKSYYQINQITANDLEKISVTFKNPFNDPAKMDEASAEDATNYVIDGGIGAVKTASLSSDDLTVTLTVPELTEGKTYTLTINNVENLWGYAAEDVKKSFIATNDETDNSQPEVEDVSYEEKGELVVEFDEPMRGTTGTNFVVVKDKANTNYYKLLLVDKRDDDKTFIFDAYNQARMVASATVPTTAALNAGTLTAIGTDIEFEVISFDVTDLAGNAADYTSGDEEFTTDETAWSQTDKDDALEADSLSQENGNTIEVSFERPVKIMFYNKAASPTELSTSVFIPYDGDDSDSVADDGWMEFTFEITGDDDDQITFYKKGTFPDDSVELQFDFTRMSSDQTAATNDATDVAVFDILERGCYGTGTSPFVGEVYDVDVDNDDETEPVLEEIEVVDNLTILLHYSEKLKTTGAYKIVFEDEDDDDKEKTITSSSMTVTFDDDEIADIVKIKLDSNKALTDQDYDLHFTTSPRDLANNKVEDEDDVTSFIGVDTAPALDMVAAKVEGPQNITIINDVEDFAGPTSVVVTGKDADGTTVATFTLSGTSTDDELDLTIKPQNALLNETAADKKVTYTFVVTGKTYTTQSFTGSLEEAEATITTKNGTSVTLEAADFNVDVDEYAFALVNVTDDAVQDLVIGAPAAGHIQEVSGDIVITNGNFGGTTLTLDSGDVYKLVAYPLDDNNNKLGTIEMISQSFTY